MCWWFPKFRRLKVHLGLKSFLMKRGFKPNKAVYIRLLLEEKGHKSLFSCTLYRVLGLICVHRTVSCTAFHVTFALRADYYLCLARTVRGKGGGRGRRLITPMLQETIP